MNVLIDEQASHLYQTYMLSNDAESVTVALFSFFFLYYFRTSEFLWDSVVLRSGTYFKLSY